MHNSPRDHFDQIAVSYDKYKSSNRYYYNNLKNLIKELIPTNKSVLEIGCGTGDLLSAVNPKFGLGIDISSEMIKLARVKYKSRLQLKFKIADIENYKSTSSWDYVFMSDVIEHLKNPLTSIQTISKIMAPKTVLVITMANPLWEPILMLAEKLHLKMPEGPHLRITSQSLIKILSSSGLKLHKHDYSLLFPVWIPVITPTINMFYTQFRKYAFIEYFVAVKK